MTLASSKPRVLMVASLGPTPYVGGIENIVDTLLSSEIQEGFECVVFDTYRVPDTERTRLAKMSHAARLPFLCWARLRETEPDIVHIHFCSGIDFWRHAICLAVSRGYGAKTVFQLHGGRFIAFFEHMTPIKRFMTKRIFGLAGCVIALSCYWKEFLSDLVSSDRIRILNNPIDCERLSPGVRSPDRDTPTLLLLGRLGTAKGHYDVLKALPLVVKKHPNAKVLFAGSDEEQGATERLMQLATEAGLSQNIEFLGPVLFDAKVELLRTSTLMILPSYAENMPISVLEGMAAEMPVIATRVGAIPEVFDDGRAGLLIDAGDWHALAQNVNRLLDDPVFAASLGKIAGRRARRLWDVSRTVRRIETIYREVLAA